MQSASTLSCGIVPPWRKLCRVLLGFAVFVIGGSVSPVPAVGQVFPHSGTIASPNPQLLGEFGWEIAATGNVKEGAHEVVISAPNENVTGTPNAGRAYVFSGSEPSLRLRLESPNPENGGRFGVSAAGVGDVDGDGVKDILIGASHETVRDSGAGRAYLFSGADGKVLRTYESPNAQKGGRFGEDVAGVGDLNGDGTPDLLIGAPKEEVKKKSRAGRVYLFSGSDLEKKEPPSRDSVLAELERLKQSVEDLPEDSTRSVEFRLPITSTGTALRSPSPAMEGHFGWAVAVPGDINGDEVPDIAVSAPGEPAKQTEHAGAVYLISGADGKLVEKLQSPTPLSGDRFGYDVATVSDVDGDSVSDFVIGADGKSILGDLESNVYDSGQAYIFGGANGRLLRTMTSPNAEKEGRFGNDVAGVGDIDGDGAGDVIVGARAETVAGTEGVTEGVGRSYLYSGADGLLQTLEAPDSEFSIFGTAVADGPPGLYVGAPMQNAKGMDNAGIVHRYELSPFAAARALLEQARRERLKEEDAQAQGRKEKQQRNQKTDRQATDQEETTSQVDTRIPETELNRPNDIAVVVGNKRYEHTDIPDVDYAVRDARVMKKYLIQTLGFREENIIYVENASAAAMTRIFGTESSPEGQLYNWVKPEQSDVFVYYSGHGAPSPESGNAYFIPTDTNPSYLSQNGYPVNQFYENLAHLPAASVTVVLEACFSGVSEAGTVIPKISPAVLSVENPIVGLENGLAFTAGAADQVSTWYSEKRHGLFTYYFLNGLRGAADSNDDQAVTAKEMETYLTDQVPYRARRMHGREQMPQVVGRNKDRVLVRYEKEVPVER